MCFFNKHKKLTSVDKLQKKNTNLQQNLNVLTFPAILGFYQVFTPNMMSEKHESFLLLLTLLITNEKNTQWYVLAVYTFYFVICPFVSTTEFLTEYFLPFGS